MVKSRKIKSDIANSKKNRKVTKSSIFDIIIKYRIALIIGISVIVYAPSFTFGFTYFDDSDILITHFDWFKNLSNISQAFSRDAFLNEQAATFYRPLQTITFIFETSIVGNHAWLFHLTNLLIHCLTCIALFNLFGLLKIDKRIAILLTCVFIVHPLFIHTVNWIPARGDLLMTLFIILSLNYFLMCYEGYKTKYFIIHLQFFALAIFSKETSGLLPLICFLYIILINKNKKIIFRSKTLLFYLFWFIIILLWFVLRALAIEKVPDSDIFGLIPLIYNLRVIPETISKLFLPVNISSIPNFSLFPTVLGLLIIALIFVYPYINKNINKSIYLFGAFWFLIFTIPGMFYSHVLHEMGYDYLNHRIYLPAIGILLIISSVMPIDWFNRFNKRIIVVFMIIILIFSVMTMVQSKQYSDALSFYNTALKSNPASALGWMNRGQYKDNTGDTQGALNDYNEAIKIYPYYYLTFSNRGTVKFKMGDARGALSDFNESIRLNPENPAAYTNRGSLKGNLKDFHGSISDFDEALKFNPNYLEALINRGRAKLNLNDSIGACSDLQRAAELGSEQAKEAYKNLCK